MTQPDPDRLLTPEALEALPPQQTLLVDVGSAQRYAEAHIPGAVLVTPGELVDGRPPATGRLPELQRLNDLFSRIGLRPDLKVVAYDDEGGGWAGRLLWTLDVVRHDNWAYLDGGIHAWQASGRPLESKPNEPVPGRVQVEIHSGPVTEAEAIMQALARGDEDLLVWDARSAAEYRGERQAAARSGHIPGAVNLDWLELMDRDRELRLRRDLAELLAARGITPDKQVVTHCQTHHRSGLTWLAARLLGYPRLSAYPGSWSEWGNRSDTPIHTGAAP
ncbi:MAG: sulfurtransferase [Gammaproteobacteria bacterium]|nr:sulfurtransferase [Gammaproteobacteria bacterium]